MKRQVGTIATLVAMASPALAGDVVPVATGGRTYVQHQIVRLKSRHPEVLSIVVSGTRTAAEGPVILGSTIDRAAVFRKTAAVPVEDGAQPSADGRSVVARVPFVSRTGRPIGTVEIRFRSRPGVALGSFSATARAIAADLARNTYSAQNAVDPYPFDPRVPDDAYAQEITRRTIAAHPELAVMMIHAAAPGTDVNRVIGSNVGRIGKVGDADDLKVAEQGTNNLGLNGDGDQYETEIPLLDAAGRRVGALGLVFPFKAGEDKDALLQHAIAIRDEVAPQIRDQQQLFSRTASSRAKRKTDIHSTDQPARSARVS